jgi:hypothetical protein
MSQYYGNLSREEVMELLKRGKKSRERGKAASRFFGYLGAWIILRAGDGWLFMLLFGILHAKVSPAVPALGYWTALFLWVLLFSLANVVRSQGKIKKL